MHIEAAYPTKYIKSADLQGKRIRVVIDRFEIEEVGDGDRKPVIYFQGKERGMVLNRTNADTIAYVFGMETDDWIGQSIELYVERVRFGNKMVDGLRVRAIKGANGPTPAPQRPAPAPSAGMAPPHGEEDYGAPLNDDIPF